MPGPRAGVMLNVGKLAPGGESYYLDTVASGQEEYYTGAGEAAGTWTGDASALGLSGDITPEDLRAVLGACDPRSGQRLPASTRRRVPGFDLAFRAPKSVSLLWALGDPATGRAVRAGHDRAVDAALAYLSGEAAVSRRGHNGVEQVQGAGFVAAAFSHRTSRAGDPLLHTHVLVANLVRCEDDGVWRSLDARALYAHAKTAGYVYQAVLRGELTRDLGVDWSPVDHGTADVAGLPRKLVEAFSRRRAQILAALHARGEHSAKAAQTATLATRQPKQPLPEGVRLREHWRARAEQLGFDRADVDRLLGVTPVLPLTVEREQAAAQRLGGADGLTAHASTFTRRDVVQGWCEQLRHGADLETILALTDRFLHPQTGLTVELVPDCDPLLDAQVDSVVDALAERLPADAAAELRRSTDLRRNLTAALQQGWTPQRLTGVLLARELASAERADAVLAWRAQQLPAPSHQQPETAVGGVEPAVRPRGPAGERVWSAPELLAVERRAVEQTLGRQHAGVAVVDARLVERLLAAYPSLSDEQAEMVRRLASDGHGVHTVVGKAGAGKTHALRAAHHLWTTAGIPVTGAALAARAALQLHDGARIPSTTIHRLLADLDRPGVTLPRGGVLVVDEAGMVGTRQLARLLDHATRTDTKVVLVGDPHQLPEIDAGGLYRALCQHTTPIVLTGNRRQTQPWERDALDQLRHGEPAVGLAAYTRRGRVITAETGEHVREQLVDRWWHAHQTRPEQTSVMIAPTLADVADLNHRARQRKAAAGQLGHNALHVDGVEFRVGDHVVALRNDRRRGLLNGTRATITALNNQDRSLRLCTEHGTTVDLAVDRLPPGQLAHGYALTCHKLQGCTVDRAWILATDQTYREWGYVALSRARRHTQLFLDTTPHEPATHDERDIPAAKPMNLPGVWKRSRAQAMALEHLER